MLGFTSGLRVAFEWLTSGFRVAYVWLTLVAVVGYDPQLGKERKVPTRTELWNNTPKETLRYKVEKWVRTLFSTL